MSYGDFGIPDFTAGEHVSAGALNEVARQASRSLVAAGIHADALGESYAENRPVEFWAFELKETLTQWDTVPTRVYRRFLKPTANGGEGAFETTCDATYEFNVLDLYEIGFYGDVGATGLARMFRVQNDMVGAIILLRCPSNCICGSDTSALPCGEGT